MISPAWLYNGRLWVRHQPGSRLPQVQLQLVFQHQALLEHAAVLFGVAGAELRRKHFGAGLAQQRLQALQATALDQGVVGQHAAGGRVLDENRSVGDGVEDRQQQRDTAGPRGRRTVLVQGVVEGCQGCRSSAQSLLLCRRHAPQVPHKSRILCCTCGSGRAREEAGTTHTYLQPLYGMA